MNKWKFSRGASALLCSTCGQVDLREPKQVTFRVLREAHKTSRRWACLACQFKEGCSEIPS